MNTMEVTKIVGAACGALLIMLLLQFGSEIIFHGGGGHDDHHENAYVIEVEEDTGQEEETEVVEIDFPALMAEADPAAGEKLFRACAACHKLEAGANAVGPYLHGVVDRDIAGADGYAYSDALTGAEGDWTHEALSGFLENPKDWAPGTKMAYRGMKDPEDRADLIAYIDSIDD